MRFTGRLKHGALVNRAAWTFVDQAFSSASNFLLTLFVLASASQRDFSTFSLAITTFLLLVQVFRALAAVPVVVLYSSHEAPEAVRGSRAALGLAVVAGAASALGLGVAAAVFGPVRPGIAEQLLTLAGFMPLLALQDTLRYVAFARRRPSAAAASDGSWLVLQVVFSLVCRWTGHSSPLAFLATWSAAGAAAAAVAAVTLRVLPDVSRAWSWLRQHRTLCRRLLAEFVLTSGSYYVIYFGLAALSGASALGRLKAAQALFGPATVLLLGGMALGVPESVRARGDSSTLRRFAARLSMFLAAISVASGVIAFAVLPVVGPRLFPNSWTTARPLLPLLTVFSAAIGISTGATSGLRAVDAGRWIMRARGAEGVVAVVTALPATVAAGAKGALFGLALGEIAFAAAAWRQLTVRVAAEAPALPGPG